MAYFNSYRFAQYTFPDEHTIVLTWESCFGGTKTRFTLPKAKVDFVGVQRAVPVLVILVAFMALIGGIVGDAVIIGVPFFIALLLYAVWLYWHKICVINTTNGTFYTMTRGWGGPIDHPLTIWIQGGLPGAGNSTSSMSDVHIATDQV